MHALFESKIRFRSQRQQRDCIYRWLTKDTKTEIDKRFKSKYKYTYVRPALCCSYYTIMQTHVIGTHKCAWPSVWVCACNEWLKSTFSVDDCSLDNCDNEENWWFIVLFRLTNACLANEAFQWFRISSNKIQLWNIQKLIKYTAIISSGFKSFCNFLYWAQL